MDKAYEFADASKPWGFAESISISGDKVEGNDFVGVKIGDVNETAVPHSLLNAQVRNSSDKLTFQIEEQAVEAGQEVIVDVYGKNFNNIEGYQFTMNLTGLQFADVVGASLEMTEDNFGILISVPPLSSKCTVLTDLGSKKSNVYFSSITAGLFLKK